MLIGTLRVYYILVFTNTNFAARKKVSRRIVSSFCTKHAYALLLLEQPSKAVKASLEKARLSTVTLSHQRLRGRQRKSNGHLVLCLRKAVKVAFLNRMGMHGRTVTLVNEMGKVASTFSVFLNVLIHGTLFRFKLFKSTKGCTSGCKGRLPLKS